MNDPALIASDIATRTADATESKVHRPTMAELESDLRDDNVRLRASLKRMFYALPWIGAPKSK